jgi:hypothetical protein
LIVHEEISGVCFKDTLRTLQGHQREQQEREFKMKWKGFRRAVLIAFAAAGLICSSVSAKGTDTNYTQVNGQVASGAREKYTKVRGKGKDKVTLMVYMIGSDLETNSGMATSDLNEMVYGGLDNPKLNVIVETGGCRRWRNSVISAKKLQRWDVTGQGIGLLEEKRLRRDGDRLRRRGLYRCRRGKEVDIIQCKKSRSVSTDAARFLFDQLPSSSGAVESMGVGTAFGPV